MAAGQAAPDDVVCYTVRQIAALLQVQPRTVLNLLGKYRISVLRIQATKSRQARTDIRVRLSDVRRLMMALTEMRGIEPSQTREAARERKRQQRIRERARGVLDRVAA